jgi:transposase
VHRAQITFDALDTESGEMSRGRIDATPAAVARWTGRFDRREIHVAVEACTGLLFVCDALVAAGAVPHLAEPVETRALRGRKRRAKTDREDARWLRQLLAEGRLPEAWIPPEHVRQWRSRAQLARLRPLARARLRAGKASGAAHAWRAYGTAGVVREGGRQR